MKTIKQTVFLLLKVENKLPKLMERVFTIDSLNRKSVHQRTLSLDDEIHDKNDFLNFGDDSKVVSFLKEVKGYFHTKKQLNQLLSDVIKDALDTASESKFISELGKGTVCHSENAKQSIKNTFEEVFNKHKQK